MPTDPILSSPRPASPALRGPIRPDTRKLLVTGSSIFFTGVVCAVLALTVLGGIGHQGPHTNSGWLAVMVAMGCLPTGTLTLLLALLKLSADRKR